MKLQQSKVKWRLFRLSVGGIRVRKIFDLELFRIDYDCLILFSNQRLLYSVFKKGGLFYIINILILKEESKFYIIKVLQFEKLNKFKEIL